MLDRRPEYIQNKLLAWEKYNTDLIIVKESDCDSQVYMVKTSYTAYIDKIIVDKGGH